MKPKKSCPHGAVLPYGLQCSRGYLAIRLKTPTFFRGCGAHTKQNERLAVLALNSIREKQFLNTWALPEKARSMEFTEASALFFQKHYVEWKHPTTNKPRTKASVASAKGILSVLNSFLNGYHLEAINVPLIKDLKADTVDFKGHAPGTFNRRKAFLSTLFTEFKRWNEEGTIETVKLPKENPCNLVPDLEEVPEKFDIQILDCIKRLKQACLELKDNGMWTIIFMALDTTLRPSDLERLHMAPTEDGMATLQQGKTGNDVYVPAGQETSRALFINRRKRWEDVRAAAGFPTLTFRYLRKMGLQLLQELNYADDVIAGTAGHKDSTTTKRWYLKGKNAAQLKPVFEARRKLLETI